jgi:DNA-binding transcriptional MocR family regulator
MDYMSYIRAIRSSDLSGIQKITAIMIASHYDFTKGDPAFPTNKTLAKETGFSISAIVKAKKVLSERGYLCSQVRWDNSCLYTPMIPDAIPYATTNKLNTHINTHINTKEIEVQVSNETLVSYNNLSPDKIDEFLSW